MGDRVMPVMSLCCHFDKKWTVEMSTATCDSLWLSAGDLQVPAGHLQTATDYHRLLFLPAGGSQVARTGTHR